MHFDTHGHHTCRHLLHPSSCTSVVLSCLHTHSHRDAAFPFISVFSIIFGLICSPPIRFPFSVFSIFSYFIFLFLNFLSLFVFIFCETARTRRFSVIFAKVQWHPCSHHTWRHLLHPVLMHVCCVVLSTYSQSPHMETPASHLLIYVCCVVMSTYSHHTWRHHPSSCTSVVSSCLHTHSHHTCRHHFTPLHACLLCRHVYIFTVTTHGDTCFTPPHICLLCRLVYILTVTTHGDTCFTPPHICLLCRHVYIQSPHITVTTQTPASPLLMHVCCVVMSTYSHHTWRHHPPCTSVVLSCLHTHHTCSHPLMHVCCVVMSTYSVTTHADITPRHLRLLCRQSTYTTHSHTTPPHARLLCRHVYILTVTTHSHTTLPHARVLCHHVYILTITTHSHTTLLMHVCCVVMSTYSQSPHIHTPPFLMHVCCVVMSTYSHIQTHFTCTTSQSPHIHTPPLCTSVVSSCLHTHSHHTFTHHPSSRTSGVSSCLHSHSHHIQIPLHPSCTSVVSSCLHTQSPHMETPASPLLMHVCCVVMSTYSVTTYSDTTSPLLMLFSCHYLVYINSHTYHTGRHPLTHTHRGASSASCVGILTQCAWTLGSFERKKTRTSFLKNMPLLHFCCYLLKLG